MCLSLRDKSWEKKDSCTSHKDDPGTAFVKTECARLMISDSVVEREVEVLTLA